MEIFHNAWDWIKKHPLIVVAVIGILFILYLVSTVSSGGTTTVTDSQPSDAAVQAGAAVQIAQLQAQSGSDQLNAALSAQQSNNAASITYAGIQAQVANYQTEQSANVQTIGIQAQENVSTQGIQSQQAIALANDATQVQLQQITASTQQSQIAGIVSIYNAPYNLQEAQLTALGPGGLSTAIQTAQDVKNAYLNIGGIQAGRNTNSGGSASAASSIGSAISGIGTALIGLL